MPAPSSGDPAPARRCNTSIEAASVDSWLTHDANPSCSHSVTALNGTAEAACDEPGPRDGPEAPASASLRVNLNPVLQLQNGDVLIDIADLLLLSSYLERAQA